MAVLSSSSPSSSRMDAHISRRISRISRGTSCREAPRSCHVVLQTICGSRYQVSGIRSEPLPKCLASHDILYEPIVLKLYYVILAIQTFHTTGFKNGHIIRWLPLSYAYLYNKIYSELIKYKTCDFIYYYEPKCDQSPYWVVVIFEFRMFAI